MPISMQLLDAPPCAESVPVFVYTRKNHRSSKPPKPTDTIAWRWNGVPHPELVFRSQLDRDVWMTREERGSLIRSLINEGLAFTSRRGFIPILNPTLGDIGWKKYDHTNRRHRVQFNGTMWIPWYTHTADDR